MQRPHHGASARALSVSDTPAADAKAPVSDVPFASFQLPARALNVSDTHAADAKAPLSDVPFSSLVAERALYFDADEAMNNEANSVCVVPKGSFAFRCSCLDHRLSHRHGI